MTQASQMILSEYQVRKTDRQKAAFRSWLCGELKKAGYEPQEEHSRLSGHNIVVGAPERAKVLLAAHYDTQPVLPIPNFITPRNMGIYLIYQLLLCLPLFLAVFAVSFLSAVLELPLELALLLSYAVFLFCLWWLFFGKANLHTANDNTSGVITLLETALALPEEERDKVCFVFFDNEEKGMLGSAAFTKKYPAVKKETLVLNFDCVSDGDFIQFFPTKALKKDAAALQALEEAFLGEGDKQVEVVREAGFYPSDNMSFCRACGVCALKKKGSIYYMDRIHTARDTVFDENNIVLLKDGCLRLARMERV